MWEPWVFVLSCWVAQVSVEGTMVCQSGPTRPCAETGALFMESSAHIRHGSSSHSPPSWQGSHPQAAPDFDFSTELL